LRISAYIISLLFITGTILCQAQVPVPGQESDKGPDSIKVPLHIRAGFDIYGPVSYFTNRNNLNIEGFMAMERTSKKTLVIEAGFQNFKYSQYNYSYHSTGAFIKGGVDFNMIQPFLAAGKYYAGVGLRYGLSIFNSEISSFKHDNYWGTATGSLPSSLHLAHFIEFTPGIKTEILKNVSIGWNLRLRLMVYSGTARDLKPVSVPGYGNGAKSFSPGINYYIIINFPYKSVFVKPEVEKIPEKTTPPGK
jgi:hypothetical protein